MTIDGKRSTLLLSLIMLMKNEYEDFTDFNTKLCIYQHINYLKEMAEVFEIPLSEIDLEGYEIEFPSDTDITEEKK